MEPFFNDTYAWPNSTRDHSLHQNDACSVTQDPFLGDSPECFPQPCEYNMQCCAQPSWVLPHVELVEVLSTGNSGRIDCLLDPSNGRNRHISDTYVSSCAPNIEHSYFDPEDACRWESPHVDSSIQYPVSELLCNAHNARPEPLPSACHPSWSLDDHSALNEVSKFVPDISLQVQELSSVQLTSAETQEAIHFSDAFSPDASNAIGKMNSLQKSRDDAADEVLLLDARGLSATAKAAVLAGTSSMNHEALSLSLLVDLVLQDDGQSIGRAADTANAPGHSHVLWTPEPEATDYGSCRDLCNFTDTTNLPSTAVSNVRGGLPAKHEVGVPFDQINSEIPLFGKGGTACGADYDSEANDVLATSSLRRVLDGGFGEQFHRSIASMHEVPDSAYSESQSYLTLHTQPLDHDIYDAKPDSGASRTSSRVTLQLQQPAGSTGDVMWDTLESCLESSDQEVSGSLKHVTLDALQSVYHLPINKAAEKLGIGVTVLKKVCRKFNIPRWPYRKLKCLEKLENSMKSVLESSLKKGIVDDPGSNDLAGTLEMVQKYRKLIPQDPSVDLDPKVKQWRQRIFKMRFKQRHTTV